MDFCDDNWIGKVCPEIKFGDWVKQDGFHLKAFYTDWLRGVGIVGYQIFDEMEAQMPEEINRIWKRSEMADGNKSARCYPDGFPCALYLNGEFYGLYVWQLKKNHKNMAQKKNQLTHIHLDGNLGDHTFWGGDIDWSGFEVRNPRGLTDQNGNNYDRNNPTELSDSPVKQSIIALSQRCSELTTMKKKGAMSDEIRAYISTYFDVESVVNYLAFSTVVSNYDGFTKNWQWFTYDGEKWFVAPYDLDCTFGNIHKGTFVFPPEYSYVDSDYTFQISKRGIATWFWNYYFNEIKTRYSDLRDTGIFDATHISAMLRSWYDRIGNTLYGWEWEAWPNSMCINPTITNPGWETCNDWTNYYYIREWKSDQTFEAGDLCRLDYRLWRATTTTTGVKPYVQMGYIDSLERYCAWILRRIELDDEFFGYDPANIRTIEIRDNEATMGPAVSIHTLDGISQRSLTSGLNLVRYSNGAYKTILKR